MIESFLITSRETLEASLIIGIVFAYLNRTNNKKYKKTVYYGIIIGILASIVAGFLFNILAGDFEGRAEQIFEGITMIIGSFLLTTMILWMMNQKLVAEKIEGRLEKRIYDSNPLFSHIGIFLVIFIAIIREGVETVIFLNALKYSNGVDFIGSALGIIVAITIGYLFFISVKHIHLKRLFNISSILLILFAAGLVAHGIHEFEEAGIIPKTIEHVWDINPSLNSDGTYPALHEKGAVGSFLVGLLGYNGNPSLLEVIAYFGYLVSIFILYKKIENTKLKNDI